MADDVEVEVEAPGLVAGGGLPALGAVGRPAPEASIICTLVSLNRLCAGPGPWLWAAFVAVSRTRQPVIVMVLAAWADGALGCSD